MKTSIPVKKSQKSGLKDTSILTNPYTFKKPKISGPYTSIYLIRHCHPAYELQEKLGDLKMRLVS